MTGPWSSLLLSLLVVGAGASVALQQVLNARLRADLGSPWWAGFTSYLVGTLAMLLAIALTASAPPALAAAARAPWTAWLGGLFGAIFIGVAILAVPRLGAATVLALIVVGQMLGALLYDHFGLFGLAQQQVTPTRLLGAALLIGGVLLIRR